MSNRIKYNLNIFLPFIIGGLAMFLLGCYFKLNLVRVFGDPNSYVYYYTFSTIAQGYVALVAFLGTLAVFKLQRDESRKSPAPGKSEDFILELDKAQRDLTFDLKKFAVTCLFNIGFAIVGIPLIPLFNQFWPGPFYLGGNVSLSFWVLYLSYPIIQTVLRLGPKDPYLGG